MRATTRVSSLATARVTLRRVPLESTLMLSDVLAIVACEPWPFALAGAWAGGGAIVGASPLIVADPGSDPFPLLDALPEMEIADAARGAVGGGWFGWLGYRVGRRIEDVPEAAARPVALPDFHLAYYDNVLRLDAEGRWWFEALVSPARETELGARLQIWRHRLASVPPSPAYVPPAVLALAPGARQAHIDAVAECRERIASGEIFQANICLRLQTRWSGSPLSLFARALSSVQPPYGSAFATPWGGLASLSPELFLRRQDERVTTAPIKGTACRPDGRQPAAESLRRLQASVKDAAEHVMIVDLMRNDLGRVCAYGTVEADAAPTAEAHPGVWHLVSRVRGRLRAGVENRELLRATFPPGSVTGAPKVQAMRVIAELETTGREVYTGAIGYASPVAGLELSVAIRTLELRGDRLWLGAGGGVVADSNPEAELEEALDKARPIAAAVGSAVSSDDPAPDPHHGVFETLLVRDGRVQALGRHVTRLGRAVTELYGRPLPEDLMLRVSDHARALVGPHRMRLDAVPKDGTVELTVSSRPLELSDGPVTLAPVRVPGGPGRYKWRDRRRLDALSGSSGSPETIPLILDEGEEILEAAWANVWILERETLVTPVADGRLLPGVTRALLLEHAAQMSLTAREEPISPARAAAADAIFLTSSLRHAVSARLDSEGREHSSASGLEIVARLRGRLSALAWGPVRDRASGR